MVEVTNIDYATLSEDVKSELERIISLAATSLIQRYFITKEYPIVGVHPETKVYMLELFGKMFTKTPIPKEDFTLYMRLHLDEADVPVFQSQVHDCNDNPVASSFVRFNNVGDLYQVYYNSNYKSFAERLKNHLQVQTLISNDFINTAKAVLENNQVFFGINIE